MVQGKLKVLLFEDNPGDVLLIEEMFKDDVAIRFKLSSVARLADGIKLLSEQEFDAVLLDLNLPDSSGIATARRLKQSAPDLPIVILTSLVDECMALEALRIGMEDYLVKGQITGALLAHSLRYAIERKRVEKTLRESELKYRSLVEQSLVGILIVQDGHIVYMNNLMAEKSGYSVDEAMSLSPEQLRGLIHPDDRDAVWNRMIRRLAGDQEPVRNECRFVVRDGSVYWADVNASLIEYLGMPAIQMFVVDITERKRAEEALIRITKAVESSSEAIGISDAQGHHFYHNQAFTDLFEYTPQELEAVGGGPAAYEDRDVAREVFDTIMSGGSRSGEVEMVSKSGRKFLVMLRANAIKDEFGKVIGLVGVHTDITDRKEAEATLQESERKYRSLVEQSLQGLMVIQDDRPVFVNNPLSEITGYTDDEILSMSIADILNFIHPDDRENIKSRYFTRRAGEAYRRVEYRIVRKDGAVRWVDTYFSTIEYEGRIAVQTAFVDITERKRAEEALRESEGRYRLLAENVSDVIWVSGMDMRLTYVSPSVTRLMGYTVEETLERTVSEAFTPDSLAAATQIFSQEIALEQTGQGDPQRSRILEMELYRKDGTTVPVEANFSFLRSAEGNPVGILAMVRDISERKRADEALRASEERMRSLFEVSPDVIMIIDREGRILSINRATTRTIEKTIGTPVFDYIPTEYHSAYAETIERMFRTGKPDRIETCGLGPGGRISWYEARFVSVRSGNEEPTLMVVATDITDRKLADEALRESEEKYRGLFDESIAVVYVFDAKKNFINTNQAGLDLLGYSREELLRMSIPDVDADPVIVLPAHQELLSGGRLINYEHKLRRKDGTIVSVLNNSRPLTDAQGNIVGMLSTLVDVTERKRAEEALQARERYFRAISDLSSGAALVVNLEGNIVDITGGLERISGHSRESTLGRSALEFIHPDDLGKAGVAFDEALRNPGKTVVFEARLKNMWGKWQWTESMITNLLDHHDIRGIVNHLVDITERKKAEEALRESERNYRQLIETLQEGIWAIDKEANTTFVNPRMAEMLGFTVEEMQGKPLFSFMDARGVELANRLLDRRRQGISEQHDFEFLRKDGTRVYVTLETGPITDDQGNYIGSIAGVQDVTERRKAEEEIRYHAKRIEALYSIAQVVSQSSTIDAILSEALDKVCDVMDTEAGCIFMLELDDNALKLKAYRGLSEDVVFKLSTITVTEQAIEQLMNLTAPITDIAQIQAVVDAEGIREVVTELGAKAVVAAPLFRGKDLQGLIVVFTIQERTFSHDDLGLLTAIANEIAVGLNNIMLLEKTRDLSVTDELTGLYNRRHFFEMLDVEMNRAARTNRPFSLVMLDLDGFKEYNDKFGHINGDAALQAFSQMLKVCIRKSDMAFRYGGDEFALILPTADAARAKKIMQRARSIWQKSPVTHTQVVGGHVDFSSGIAEYPGNAESADGLVFLADAALYQAKRKGGHEDKLVSELSTLSAGILDMATQDQVYALAATVDSRDPYTYGHSQRVAEIAKAIGIKIGMSEDEVVKLHAAALLHDIGKVGVPDAILTKMGKPSEEEWRVIKRHSAEGARIVSYVKELASLVPIILHHHEWYDGSGYPDGLKGMDIPAGARITSIADAYDTMVTKRPYRNVVSHKEACKELKRFAGVQFDPVLVGVWCKLVEEAEKK